MSFLLDISIIAGLCLITYGLAQIHVSLALVFVGVSLVTCCLAIAQHKRPKHEQIIVNVNETPRNDN